MQALPITIRDSLFTISELYKPCAVLYSKPMENLGEKLRKAREDKGLERRLVMDQMGYANKSTSRIANYELGDREPSLADLTKMASIYGMTLVELLQYGDPNPLVQLGEKERAILEIWDEMEKEERDLWLQRGRKILETREGGEVKAQPAGKNATWTPRKTSK